MKISICALLALSAAIGSSTAVARTGEGSTLVTDPVQVQRILSALDDGVWVADGAAGERHIYVIYDTTCGYSKKFFADTRALSKRPQLRWLTAQAQGRGAEGVVSLRTPTSVGDAFAGKYSAPADAAAAQRAIAINQALLFVMPDVTRVGYPTLIYKTAQGLKIYFGAPANMQKLAAEVEARPDRASYQPAGLRWMNEPSTATRLKEYVNFGDKPVPVRFRPSADAPVVQEIRAGNVVPVDSIAADEWARVGFMKLGRSTVYGYVHAPREIKLASLQYTVQPARGVFKTGKRTFDVREQPSVDASVLERVEPGIEMKKTGEVMLDGRKWTEVLVYTDGTKGYIAE